MTDQLFKSAVPALMHGLRREFGLTDFQAAGVFGNAGHESAGFTMLRELGASPGHGGYGWFQWTGPRAEAFLSYAAHNYGWRSTQANYGYLLRDLHGPYAHCVAALRRTHDIVDATRAFEITYEMAGVVAMTDRIEWAHVALRAYQLSAYFGDHGNVA